jgi:hypothetical protein
MKNINTLLIMLIAIAFSACNVKNDSQLKTTEKPKAAQNQELSTESVTLNNYQNDTIGISLDYPNNYSLSEPTPRNDVVIIRVNKKNFLQIQGFESSPPDSENYRPFGADFIENTTIDSKKTYKYFTENPEITEAPEGLPFTLYLIEISDQKWIEIEYFGEESKFEVIINSIKFNNKTIDSLDKQQADQTTSTQIPELVITKPAKISESQNKETSLEDHVDWQDYTDSVHNFKLQKPKQRNPEYPLLVNIDIIEKQQAEKELSNPNFTSVEATIADQKAQIKEIIPIGEALFSLAYIPLSDSDQYLRISVRICFNFEQSFVCPESEQARQSLIFQKILNSVKFTAKN